MLRCSSRGLDIDAIVQVLVSITANINLIVDAGGDCGCDQGLLVSGEHIWGIQPVTDFEFH